VGVVTGTFGVVTGTVGVVTGKVGVVPNVEMIFLLHYWLLFTLKLDFLKCFYNVELYTDGRLG
jgi:hypothetical protein